MGRTWSTVKWVQYRCGGGMFGGVWPWSFTNFSSKVEVSV